MSQAWGPDPNVRASDADRERIVEQLRQHTADGRLSMDEFEQRMTAAYAAKTYGELAQLTKDLPVDLGARSAKSSGPSATPTAGQQPWQQHNRPRTPPYGPFGRPGQGGTNPSDVVGALIGAAMDWKMQKQNMRDAIRTQRHQARLARRAAQPIAAGFAGWAFLSVLLTGIWFMAGVTGGGFAPFWPIWPIGILGILTAARAIKIAALRRELTRR
jgi:hypothetical protein